MKNGEKIADFVPNDGCLNFVEQIDEVLIAEFGLKRHVVGDIPCGRFKVVMVSGVSQRDLFLLLTVTIKNKFMFPAKKLAGPSKKKRTVPAKKDRRRGHRCQQAVFGIINKPTARNKFKN